MAHSILVVDDEPNIVLSLEFLMKKAGYDVRTAVDGEEAMQAIRAAPPSLILLDINIPKINGYEICESVRGSKEWCGIRIVMITAKGRDIEREKGLAMGADDYITKPFATQEVVDKVREILGEGGNNENTKTKPGGGNAERVPTG
ncbi:MAG: two-component system response regulator [Gammaproteobacteria bacterium]|nr:MAG: two-component system response regulator [Gammaproteobacteria bacterium]